MPRNEEDIKLKEVTIKEVYEIINKSRPTKSRGNNEVNMYILKQIPQLSAIALTHIINCTIRMGIFSRKYENIKGNSYFKTEEG